MRFQEVRVGTVVTQDNGDQLLKVVSKDPATEQCRVAFVVEHKTPWGHAFPAGFEFDLPAKDIRYAN